MENQIQSIINLLGGRSQGQLAKEEASRPNEATESETNAHGALEEMLFIR